MGIFSNLFKVSEPIDIILDGTNRITIHNKQEANFYAPGMLKIANDCAKLINNTKNPNVFFDRYNLLIEKLENLSKMEKFNCFSLNLPSQDLTEILNKKTSTFNDFLDRYYQDTLAKIEALKTSKSKQNKINNFCNSLNEYKEYLPTESLEKYEDFCKNLKEFIKQ